jgi:hypothetical protein
MQWMAIARWRAERVRGDGGRSGGFALGGNVHDGDDVVMRLRRGISKGRSEEMSDLRSAPVEP